MMNQVTRRIKCLLIAGGSALSVFGMAAALAQTYPSRPVRIMVPYSTGSATDVLSRVVAQKLSDAWGQTVVVDNQPGANGIPATATVANAPPDGYMLVMIAANHVVNASLYSKIPYDTVKDFRPIVRIGQVPFALCVHPALPVQTLKEFIALAKQRPGQINYASPGNGTPGHLAMEMLKTMAGINVVHVPYKGVPQALNDTLAGRMHFAFSSPMSVLPFVKQGKLRLLAVTTPQRSRALPEVPTVAESGVPGYEFTGWMGVLAPKATPPDIVRKFQQAVAKAVAEPDLEQRLAADAAEPVASTPADFAAFLKIDIARWTRVVREANIQVD